MIFRKPYKCCKGSRDAFDNYLTYSFNKHAPKNKNVLRGNENSHMNRNSRRAIIKRSKLKDKANKERDRDRDRNRERDRDRDRDTEREKLQ